MDTNTKQREAELIVFGNFGRAYANAMHSQLSTNAPEQRKMAAAAIVATSQATANVSPESINRVDAAAGRAALEKAYGARAEDVAAVLSGRVANYDLPKSVGGTQDLAALAVKGQMLAQQATRESFASRGLVQATGPRSDYLVQVSGPEVETIAKLSNHMLHVKSSIEAGVDRKVFDRSQADALYKRFENATFDKAPGNGLKNEAFAQFEKTLTPNLRADVMKDVEARYEMQRDSINRAKQKEQVPVSLGSIAQLGEKMTAIEYRDAVKKLGGESVGRIDLPKQHCTYTGKIVQVSDTHIVQKVGKNAAVAHSINKVTNGMEIVSLAAKGQMRSADMSIKYDGAVGVAKQVGFSIEKSNAAVATSKSWAEQNIGSPKAREAFGKLIESFAKGREQMQTLAKQAVPIARPQMQPQAPKR
jgi:hypothetical protein